MKRILMIIALTILPMVCHAQLNVTKQVEKMEKISSSRSGLCRFMRQGDLFYISCPTTNHYDDPFILYVGEGLESAKQTLLDLVKLCGTIEKGAPIVITNGTEECFVSKSAFNGSLDFKQDGYAASAAISKIEFNKFYNELKKLKE